MSDNTKDEWDKYCERIGEESDRFLAALPDLMKDTSLIGRVVVFKDGTVRGVFDDFWIAQDACFNILGANNEAVIARVSTQPWH